MGCKGVVEPWVFVLVYALIGNLGVISIESAERGSVNYFCGDGRKGGVKMLIRFHHQQAFATKIDAKIGKHLYAQNLGAFGVDDEVNAVTV